MQDNELIRYPISFAALLNITHVTINQHGNISYNAFLYNIGQYLAEQKGILALQDHGQRIIDHLGSRYSLERSSSQSFANSFMHSLGQQLPKCSLIAMITQFTDNLCGKENSNF